MEFVLVASACLAMGSGVVCLIVTYGDAFPRPTYTAPNPVAPTRVVGMSGGRDGGGPGGCGTWRSAGGTP
jgi:hypothetical protein